MSFGRLVRTLRYLRPIQVAARIRQRFPRRAAHIDGSVSLRRTTSWVDPPQWHEQSLFGDELRVVGERIPIGEWDNEKRSSLACYNAHYFDDLNAAGSVQRVEEHRRLIARWLADHARPRGVGWDSYPVSLRLVNWVKWLLRGHEPLPGQLASAGVQAAHLHARIERHLLANHVLANAKALLFAGGALDNPAASRWLRRGARTLTRELREQILPDGGHFERSPMYHALVLEDLLDLENLRRAYAIEAIPPLGETIAAMLGWLGVMTHPDGGIAFFNDAALGIAPSYETLRSYAFTLAIDAPPAPVAGVTLLRESGFARIVRDDAVLLIDAGSVGPSYQPGHAHAGTLSFELSIGGERVIVNSGTSTYEPGLRREAERATAAHNALVLNDESSSEVWASFRVGRRARVFGVRSEDDRVNACHDGYRHLAGAPRVCRAFTAGERCLVINDAINVPVASAVAHLHFAPGVAVELRDGGAEAVTPLGRRLRIDADGATMRRVATTCHPRFGASVANVSLELTLQGETLATMIAW